MILDPADASNGEPEDVLVDQDIDGEQEDNNEPEPEGEEPEDEGEEFVVQFGDEAPPASEDVKESSVIRRIREENRKLKEQLAKVHKPSTEEAPIDPGPEPTMDDPDVDYDTDKFTVKYKQWVADTQKAAAQQADREKRNKSQAEQWQAKLNSFNDEKRKMAARDFDVAEGEFVSSFDQVQQATIIKASKNSAAVVYALGKHPAKMAELSKITDPIELAAEVARIEGTLKMTKTSRTAPAPEGTVRGSASLSTGTDKVLQRLEAEAVKSGDYTKVFAHKRAQRQNTKG